MKNNSLVFAVLAFDLDIDKNKIQLFPAYDFKAKDGRPIGIDNWKINQSIATQLINNINQQQDKILIDYEHQTLETAKNGQPSPAAGWFKQLEWIEGKGLFAIGVEWTARAKQFIKNREYRYISPVFSYNKTTGEISSLHHAALVNYPAIDGMNDVTIAKANYPTAMELTQGELKILTLTGISQENYIATKTLNHKLNSGTVALQYKHGLSDIEISICQATGIDILEYMVAKNNLRIKH